MMQVNLRSGCMLTPCPATLLMLTVVARAAERVDVLVDDFSTLPSRLISSPVGAHTEYHYLPQAAPVGNWAVSTFSSQGESQRAWRVQHDGAEKVIAQTFTKKGERFWHPMLVAGDPLWADYAAMVCFAPSQPVGESASRFATTTIVVTISSVSKVAKHGC